VVRHHIRAQDLKRRRIPGMSGLKRMDIARIAQTSNSYVPQMRVCANDSAFQGRIDAEQSSTSTTTIPF
jgi:hypothetical protein